jgi:hypothetical protein
MPATTDEVNRIIAAIQSRVSSDGSDIAKVAIGDPSGDQIPEIEVKAGDETQVVEGPFDQGTQMIAGELFAVYAAGIADYLIDKLIPIGTILAFNGAAGSVPAGWAICDGTGGTPNLTNRFIRGAATAGGTGGGAADTDGPSHITSFYAATSGVFQTTVAASSHTHNSSNLPSYYDVIYIIRQE